jgi:hypothetical protein
LSDENLPQLLFSFATPQFLPSPRVCPRKLANLRYQLNICSDYFYELCTEGIDPFKAREICSNRRSVLREKLAILDVPTKQETNKALKAASKELKHVFGILGINAKTFVFLVNETHLKTIQDIIDYDPSELYRLADVPGIQREFLYELVYWFDWFDHFYHTRQREPQLLREFSKPMWTTFKRNDTRYNEPDDGRRRQPPRQCKKLNGQNR